MNRDDKLAMLVIPQVGKAAIAQRCVVEWAGEASLFGLLVNNGTDVFRV